MARPIKETPVLTGKDARRFEEQVRKSESQKVPESEYRRAHQAYERVKLER